MKGIHKLSMLRLTKFCQIQSSLKKKKKKNQIKGNKRTGISLSYPQVQNKSNTVWVTQHEIQFRMR